MVRFFLAYVSDDFKTKKMFVKKKKYESFFCYKMYFSDFKNIFQAYISDDFKTKKNCKEKKFEKKLCHKKKINFFFQISKIFFEHTFQTILRRKKKLNKEKKKRVSPGRQSYSLNPPYFLLKMLDGISAKKNSPRFFF